MNGFASAQDAYWVKEEYEKATRWPTTFRCWVTCAAIRFSPTSSSASICAAAHNFCSEPYRHHPRCPRLLPEVMRGVENVIKQPRQFSLGVSETIMQRAGKDRLDRRACPVSKIRSRPKIASVPPHMLQFKELAMSSRVCLTGKIPTSLALTLSTPRVCATTEQAAMRSAI